MAYRVKITVRASRDLRNIYHDINAADSRQAQAWFNGMEAAISNLADYPIRNPVTPENKKWRHLLYSSKSYVYRIIYIIDAQKHVVNVLHIRHASRKPLS